MHNFEVVGKLTHNGKSLKSGDTADALQRGRQGSPQPRQG